MFQPLLTLTNDETTDRPMLCLPKTFSKVFLFKNYQLREVNHAVTIHYFFTFRYILLLNSY